MTVGTNASAHLYDTTFNTNGALYSAASGVVTSTSAGAAGTVFAGSAGAPSFTATPTVTSISFGGSALGNYVATTSFTPAVKFGGGSTGLTYTTQSGNYVRIGSIVQFEIIIVLSNKGSSTGTMTITGMPIAAAGSPTFPLYIAVGVTAPASTTYSIAQIGGTTTTLSLLGINGATNAAAVYADTNVSNTTQIFINGTYQV